MPARASSWRDAPAPSRGLRCSTTQPQDRSSPESIEHRPISPLRPRMIEDMCLRKLSENTQSGGTSAESVSLQVTAHGLVKDALNGSHRSERSSCFKRRRAQHAYTVTKALLHLRCFSDSAYKT